MDQRSSSMKCGEDHKRMGEDLMHFLDAAGECTILEPW
jgi:hypothetical protein